MSPELVRQPERLEKSARKTSVLTPKEFMRDVECLLPQAEGVDMLFMAAQGRPLTELARQVQALPRENNTEIRFAVSGHLDKYFAGHKYFTALPLYPLLRYLRPNEVKQTREAASRIEGTYDRLRDKGAQIFPTKAQGGVPTWILPIAGHMHSKWVQIRLPDKVVTYQPEFSLTEFDIDNAINFAMRIEESGQEAKRPDSVSSVVKEYYERIINKEKFSDYAVKIDGKNDLVFLADAGRVGRSIIHDEAVKMVRDEATHDIFFASQFPPAGGVLTEIIRKAEQGGQATILLSENCQRGLAAKRFRQRIRGLEDSIHVVYAPGRVHSKLLMVNTGIHAQLMPDGTTKLQTTGVKENAKAQSSSNNNHPVGYGIGTGESGFMIQDTDLIRKIAAKVTEISLPASESA